MLHVRHDGFIFLDFYLALNPGKVHLLNPQTSTDDCAVEYTDHNRPLRCNKPLEKDPRREWLTDS